MNIAAALNHWIHLISAVIWIGSLAFVVMMLNPTLKGKLPKETLEPLVRGLQAKYLRITGGLLTLILITGVLNVKFVREALMDFGGLPKSWLLFLGLKLTLATLLISVFLLNVLYRNEPQSDDQTTIPWARQSFYLGIFILLSAAFLRHSHS